jgi:hypothetical protein
MMLKGGDIIDIYAYVDITNIMANLTIRDLPDTDKESLKVPAAKAGVSLESFVRGLLKEVFFSAGRLTDAFPGELWSETRCGS